MHPTLPSWLAVAILSLLASASPTPSVPATVSKVPIPLRKHIKIADDGGVVDHIVLDALLSRAAAKISRGFENFYRRTGSLHPSDEGVQLRKRVTGATNLTNFFESLWFGEIAVGTPPVTFTVDFDTGSSDTFLPSVFCSVNCDGHKLYNPRASSTAVNVSEPFSSAFGDGSTVQGDQFNDTVIMGGGNLTAANQRIGAATVYSDGFAIDTFPSDGLLGMGFPQIGRFDADPVFHTLISQNQTDEPVFAFKLTANDSELFLGAFNSSKFMGELTRVNVTQPGFWQVQIDSADVGGSPTSSNITSIIDTGTTLVLGDFPSVSRFYASIPGASDASTTVGSGFFSFPCDAAPNLNVSLTFGGKAFSISPETFNLGRASANTNDCVGGIAALDGLKFWIVGDVFLQNVYSVFDVGNEQVGFAELA